MSDTPETTQPCPRCLELARAYEASTVDGDTAAALASLVTAIVHVADTHGATLDGQPRCRPCRRYKTLLRSDPQGVLLAGWRKDAALHFAAHTRSKAAKVLVQSPSWTRSQPPL
ncbi:hypothetical protein ACIRPQ_29070 [Streptomyces sp. NPDC101213]|uniref:hypothetical protein n=1 Tax=Streptomyces sp. NPDC101213 TaxID=3366130 RepID=UPI00381279E8